MFLGELGKVRTFEHRNYKMLYKGSRKPWGDPTINPARPLSKWDLQEILDTEQKLRIKWGHALKHVSHGVDPTGKKVYIYANTIGAERPLITSGWGSEVSQITRELPIAGVAELIPPSAKKELDKIQAMKMKLSGYELRKKPIPEIEAIILEAKQFRWPDQIAKYMSKAQKILAEKKEAARLAAEKAAAEAKAAKIAAEKEAARKKAEAEAAAAKKKAEEAARKKAEAERAAAEAKTAEARKKAKAEAVAKAKAVAAARAKVEAAEAKRKAAEAARQQKKREQELAITQAKVRLVAVQAKAQAQKAGIFGFGLSMKTWLIMSVAGIGLYLVFGKKRSSNRVERKVI